MTASNISDKKNEQDKLRLFMEKMFYLFLALELIYEVLRTTPFPGYAEELLAKLFAGQAGLIFQGICSIRLLMFVPAVYTIFMEMGKWRERITALAMIGLGIVYSVLMAEWNDHTILMLMLLLVASYGREFRRIAAYSIAIVSVLYIFTAVVCIFGLIPEYNMERAGRIRHSLGFYGVSAAAAFMCFVLLMMMFLKSGIIKWYDYLLIVAVILFNIWLIDGRVALVSVILVTAGAAVCTAVKKHGLKITEKLMKPVRLVLCFSHLIVGGLFFTLVFAYDKERWSGIRKLPFFSILENRLAVPNRLMQELPFSFFGNYLDRYAYAEQSFYSGVTDVDFLESSYARLYLIYGLVGLILALVIYTVVQWRLMKKEQTFRMYVIAVTAFFFVIQKGILNPGISIFPLLLTALIPPAEPVPITQDIYVGERDANGVLKRAYEGIDMWELYRKKPLSYKIMKRLVDIVGSIVAMILLLPAFIGTAIAIKLEDGGPVIYSGKRYGKDLKYFPMHKFRSMCIDAEKKTGAVITDEDKNGLAFKIKDDPRITKVGRFIRKTSIDELPQFWNVLKGQMSLVGPRPIQTTDKEIEDYEKQRWAVKPGITCIWQVCGRALVPWDEWVEMDLKYISEMSLKTDIKLMIITVVALWSKEGAM